MAEQGEKMQTEVYCITGGPEYMTCVWELTLGGPKLFKKFDFIKILRNNFILFSLS